ncbi:MAG: cupin domain-containing protein [Clostridia bacterium]|nr:cupin domain-containing protein [Clostridia bacterium]
MIKFDETNFKVIPNFNGGEKEFRANMVVDELNKILKGTLIPGASIGLHRHETSSEIIFFLSGNGKMITDGVEERVTAGDCHYCKKGSEHTMINDGKDDLVFYAVVPQQ